MTKFLLPLLSLLLASLPSGTAWAASLEKSISSRRGGLNLPAFSSAEQAQFVFNLSSLLQGLGSDPEWLSSPSEPALSSFLKRRLGPTPGPAEEAAGEALSQTVANPGEFLPRVLPQLRVIRTPEDPGLGLQTARTLLEFAAGLGELPEELKSLFDGSAPLTEALGTPTADPGASPGKAASLPRLEPSGGILSPKLPGVPAPKTEATEGQGASSPEPPLWRFFQRLVLAWRTRPTSGPRAKARWTLEQSLAGLSPVERMGLVAPRKRFHEDLDLLAFAERLFDLLL